MDLSIIVPTYHEADNITRLAKRIQLALAEDFSYEILIVDDNSNDGIEEIVSGLTNQGVPIQCLVRKENPGLSRSVIFGFSQAQGQILVCMDADLAHPPESLPELIKPLLEKRAQFTLGSRYIIGGSVENTWSLFRWLNSFCATFLSWPLHGGKVRDPMSGYFAIPTHLLQKAPPLNPMGWKIGLELLVKCGCHPIIEIPIHFELRTAGKSKLTIKTQIINLYHLATLYWFKFMGKSSQSHTSGNTP